MLIPKKMLKRWLVKSFLTSKFIDESQQNELAALIGFEAIDSKHGSIGKVTDILDNTAQELFRLAMEIRSF